jgi:hypothetical protein
MIHLLHLKFPRPYMRGRIKKLHINPSEEMAHQLNDSEEEVAWIDREIPGGNLTLRFSYIYIYIYIFCNYKCREVRLHVFQLINYLRF